MPRSVVPVPLDASSERPTSAPSPRSTGASREATRPHLTRRRLLACLAWSPLLLAASCQGLPSPIAFPTATPTGPRPLRLAIPSESSTDAITTLVKDVAQHFPPDAQLTLEPVPVSVGTNADEMPARYAEGLRGIPAKDTPDLILDTPIFARSLDKANLIRDLMDGLRSEGWFTAEDFYGNALVGGQLRGRQVAVPLDLEVEAVFYNQTMFEQEHLSPPRSGWTWDELLAAAQSLTVPQTGDSPARWGFQVTPLYPTFTTMGWQRDAKVIGDDGTSLDLTESGTAEGMQLLADLILRQKVSAPLKPEIVADPLRGYEATNDSMVAVNTYRAAMIAYQNSPFFFWWRPLNQGDVALAEMPMANRRAVTGGSTILLSVPTDPRDEKHSLNGLRYLLDASSQSLFLPARKGVSDLRKLQPFLTEAEASALSSTLEVVRCLPCAFAGNQDLYTLLMREYVVPILAGQKTAAQAGHDTQPLVAKALASL